MKPLVRPQRTADSAELRIATVPVEFPSAPLPEPQMSRETPDLQGSPLPDSNRRPLPYHGSLARPDGHDVEPKALHSTENEGASRDAARTPDTPHCSRAVPAPDPDFDTLALRIFAREPLSSLGLDEVA